MTRRFRRVFAVALCVAPFVLARDARADDPVGLAQDELRNVSAEMGSVQTAIDRAREQRMSPEQRLANGEILYRTKDYDRALIVFSEIIEGYPETPSYVNAVWLRAETFYAAGEYLSARRDYKVLVKRGNEARFSPYLGRALARLVDVSIRVNDLTGLDEIIAGMNNVAADAALLYAKGKAYYAKKDYSQANSVFAQVPLKADYTHQARYFQGLIAMKQAQPGPPTTANSTGKSQPTTNYKPAIDLFKQVTDLTPDTPEHRHVIDLAWMAIGRLAYEMEQFQLASEAYAKVGRDSPEFDTMLYELAWVYVRLGDVQRAERALEVLSIADPESVHLADGTLLRADLLLRAGAFDKALSLYQTVRQNYDPMRVKLEGFLDANQDVKVFYEKLAAQQLDTLDQADQVPAVTVKWARQMEDGPAAFGVIDDIVQCKKLIKDSEQLIEKLNAIINASNRVRAFPELLAGETLALGLINRISKARYNLARGMDDAEPGSLSGEIGDVRDKRRALMDIMKNLPTNESEFAERDRQGSSQWNSVSQALQRNQLEIDQLQAVVNGLRRMLREDAQNGVVRDPDQLKRFNEEIDANEKLLKQYREQSATLRRMVEIGKMQQGLGDSRYQSDAIARADFQKWFDREVTLAANGQAGNDARGYSTKIIPILAQAKATEDQLISAFMQLEAQVAAKTTELKKKIDAEAVNIQQYKQELADLDTKAQDLVGQVARRNFVLVRDKLRNIVLRADVGITEQAWEVREEEMERVHNLQTERARQEQLLDEELKEVLDDSAGEAPKK